MQARRGGTKPGLSSGFQAPRSTRGTPRTVPVPGTSVNRLMVSLPSSSPCSITLLALLSLLSMLFPASETDTPRRELPVAGWTDQLPTVTSVDALECIAPVRLSSPEQERQINAEDFSNCERTQGSGPHQIRWCIFGVAHATRTRCIIFTRYRACLLAFALSFFLA